jgi:hypothetical protein
MVVGLRGYPSLPNASPARYANTDVVEPSEIFKTIGTQYFDAQGGLAVVRSPLS